MTRILDIYLRRHMESFIDADRVKHDGPSLEGIFQAKELGKEIKSENDFLDRHPSSKVIFYTSPRYRTQIAAQIAIEEIDPEVGYKIAPALDIMRRSKAYETALKAVTKGQGEDAIVAYCMDSENLIAEDQETESPKQLGERYLGHVHSLARHFNSFSFEDGQQMRIENLTHEPGLTATIMKVLGIERYDASFSGAAKTGEAIHFKMQPSQGGLILVEMSYRTLQHEYTIPQ